MPAIKQKAFPTIEATLKAIRNTNGKIDGSFRYIQIRTDRISADVEFFVEPKFIKNSQGTYDRTERFYFYRMSQSADNPLRVGGLRELIRSDSFWKKGEPISFDQIEDFEPRMINHHMNAGCDEAMYSLAWETFMGTEKFEAAKEELKEAYNSRIKSEIQRLKKKLKS